MISRCLFACLFLALSGCQWLAQQESARHFSLAQSEDRICREDGYRWPGEAYVECRRQLADTRQRELWQEMQLSRTQASEMAISAPRPDTYRPIRPADFLCEQRRTADDEVWIDCRERN